MATFKVTNIIKITSKVEWDVAFKPYRQNFTYVLKGMDVLELRTNEPEKSLYYYKAILPYADVEMIDDFDYPTNAITYTITNGHKASADVDELRDGKTATIHIVANEGYGYPLSIDYIIVTNATKANYVAQNGGCAIDITSTGGDIDVSCSCFDPNIQITFPIGVTELGTKMAQDLQVGLTESDGVFTMGELFYVSDYSNFSTNTSGNYLPVTPSAQTFDGITNTYSVEIKNEPSWETQEFNGNFVQWVDRSASGHPAGDGVLLVTATIGTQEFTKEYDISAITLDEAQPQPTGLTKFVLNQSVVAGDRIVIKPDADLLAFCESLNLSVGDSYTLFSDSGVIDMSNFTSHTCGMFVTRESENSYFIRIVYSIDGQGGFIGATWDSQNGWAGDAYGPFDNEIPFSNDVASIGYLNDDSWNGELFGFRSIADDVGSQTLVPFSVGETFTEIQFNDDFTIEQFDLLVPQTDFRQMSIDLSGMSLSQYVACLRTGRNVVKFAPSDSTIMYEDNGTVALASDFNNQYIQWDSNTKIITSNIGPITISALDGYGNGRLFGKVSS